MQITAVTRGGRRYEPSSGEQLDALHKDTFWIDTNAVAKLACCV
jgi:hypothetical protein